ncbi:hypothetical protein TWF718_008556 [Orbilia javanica]|uniref:Uncharacterized protein n=1 Tax=Orbilia javanica TaxID=47235 RepID=A0AAN8RMY7_9PEZI
MRNWKAVFYALLQEKVWVGFMRKIVPYKNPPKALKATVCIISKSQITTTVTWLKIRHGNRSFGYE